MYYICTEVYIWHNMLYLCISIILSLISHMKGCRCVLLDISRALVAFGKEQAAAQDDAIHHGRVDAGDCEATLRLHTPRPVGKDLHFMLKQRDVTPKRLQQE